MKPIKTKTHLIKSLLGSLAILFCLLGFLLSAKSIPFFPTIECSLLATGEVQISVIQGAMSLFNAGFFLCFIFTYLHFEFYGFKSALYTAANAALGILVSFSVIKILKEFAMDANSHTDALILELFDFSKVSVIAMATATITGFASSLLIAATIKTITRNYLMILRFPIAGLAGMFCFTASKVYISKMTELAPISMLYEGIAPFSQLSALVLVMIIPLYFLRFIFGIFRGRQSDADEETKQSDSKGMFKTAEAPIITQQQAPQPQIVQSEQYTQVQNNITTLPLSTAVPLVPANENSEDLEHTVSKKIKFD